MQSCWCSRNMARWNWQHLAGPEVAADLQGAIDAVSERMELQATLHKTLAPAMT
jgi:ribosome-associated translation inhibitor RaiA